MTTKRKGYDHEKLGITFQELGALLGTRALLASGTLTHVALGAKTWCGKAVIDPNAHDFTMRYALQQDGCGTMGCIGGTMAMIMDHNGLSACTYVEDGGLRQPPDDGSGRYGAMRELFYPPCHTDFNWDRITPTVAVKAIDAFLAGKGVNWKALVVEYGLTEKQAQNRAKAYKKRVEAHMRAVAERVAEAHVPAPR